jgi:hypothetical protein
VSPPAAPRRFPWKVLYANWRDHHDWLGRRQLPRGARRVAPPAASYRYFKTRKMALDFVTELHASARPDDEFFCQIISVAGPVPKPEQLSMAEAFSWPLQSAEQVVDSERARQAATPGEPDFLNEEESQTWQHVRTPPAKSTR